jgi:hypothetical protein
MQLASGRFSFLLHSPFFPALLKEVNSPEAAGKVDAATITPRLLSPATGVAETLEGALFAAW